MQSLPDDLGSSYADVVLHWPSTNTKLFHYPNVQYLDPACSGVVLNFWHSIPGFDCSSIRVHKCAGKVEQGVGRWWRGSREWTWRTNGRRWTYHHSLLFKVILLFPSLEWFKISQPTVSQDMLIDVIIKNYQSFKQKHQTTPTFSSSIPNQQKTQTLSKQFHHITHEKDIEKAYQPNYYLNTGPLFRTLWTKKKQFEALNLLLYFHSHSFLFLSFLNRLFLLL